MALDRAFDAGTLVGLRKAVLDEAAAAGLSRDRAADVMLVVHELAANAVRHGAGTGRLAMRVRDGYLYCQVSDPGPATADRRVFGDGATAAGPWPVRQGHGLWIAQLAADRVTVASGIAGSQVTAVFTLPRRPG